MKRKTVKTARKVKYPNKNQVEINEMLLQHQPKRWSNSYLVAAVLSAVLIAQMTSCAKPAVKNESEDMRKMKMAPIFEGISAAWPSEPSTNLEIKPMLHDVSSKGTFRLLGNFPGPEPSVLTEENALSIIKQELKEEGLTCSKTSKQVTVNTNNWIFDMQVNGAEKPVYVEFMPQYEDDTRKKQQLRNKLDLSETSKQSAKDIRELLCEVNDDSAGAVFYAKEVGSRFSFSNERQENLKAQVDEFIVWLKTNGLV